jgi:hypothetical protein
MVVVEGVEEANKMLVEEVEEVNKMLVEEVVEEEVAVLTRRMLLRRWKLGRAITVVS